jgi:hypothetical protein
MEKSSLYQLVQSFSAVEKKDVRKFLRSPFFNLRDDLALLFDLLADQDAGLTDKAGCWRKIYGKAPYHDQNMRLLMSYLLRLLEQYLAYQEMLSDRHKSDLYLAASYRRRGLTTAFDRVQQELDRSLQQEPVKDARLYQLQYELSWETFQLAYVQNPTESTRLHVLSELTDVVYLIQKLRILCLLTAHESVYHSERPVDWADDILTLAEKRAVENIPAIRVYVQCYRMLRSPQETGCFQVFKQSLLTDAAHFATDEMHSLYIWAINYCIKRLNSGETPYAREALDLYQEGLERKFLLENGILSRFTYHNIVAIGLQTGEHDWVRFFIHAYKNYLEKKYRDSSFSFNLARLEYSDNRHDEVLRLLQSANYRDPLLNLSAKTLLLKTYFALRETDLLQSHLDAMRNYIHRKRVIGYHRTNYLNIIRFSEKLLRLNTVDRLAVEKYKQEIQQEPVLSEKAFFMSVVGPG